MFQVRGKVPSKISGLIPTSLSIVHDKLQTSGVGKAQHQPVLASESTWSTNGHMAICGNILLAGCSWILTVSSPFSRRTLKWTCLYSSGLNKILFCFTLSSSAALPMSNRPWLSHLSLCMPLFGFVLQWRSTCFGVQVCCNKELLQVIAVRASLSGKEWPARYIAKPLKTKTEQLQKINGLWTSLNLSASWTSGVAMLQASGSLTKFAPFPQSPLSMSSILGRLHGLDSNSTPGIGVHPFSWTNRKPTIVSTFLWLLPLWQRTNHEDP